MTLVYCQNPECDHVQDADLYGMVCDVCGGAVEHVDDGRPDPYEPDPCGL